jgi:putative transcriptional regulator
MYIYLKKMRGVKMGKNLRLKSARAAKDMSQKDVAEAVGVTRQTINAIENGDYNPSVNLCIAICRVLGKTLDNIFWEDDLNERQ